MLPKLLIDELIECMKSTFTYSSLEQFTSIRIELLIIDYKSAVTPSTPLTDGINKYVNALEQYGTLFYFIKEYYEEYKDNQLVANFYKNFEEIFENNGVGQFGIRSEYLDYILVENNSLPFIGRCEVKDAVQRMLNNRRPKVTVLKGQTRMGLTYIHRYLNEVAGRTQNFELIILNLKEIRQEYSGEDELLYASHVAAFIADFLALDTKVNANSKGEFKITPFIGQLRKAIQSNKKKYLFFIDQFDVPPANDLKNLILGIVKLSFDTTIQCYTFLSGIGEMLLKDWPVDILKIISQQQNTIPIDSFDKKQLDLYFKKIYLYLSTVYDLPGSLQDFLHEIYTNVIPISQLNPPNVEVIGSEVASWYERFCAENS